MAVRDFLTALESPHYEEVGGCQVESPLLAVSNLIFLR